MLSHLTNVVIVLIHNHRQQQSNPELAWLRDLLCSVANCFVYNTHVCVYISNMKIHGVHTKHLPQSLASPPMEKESPGIVRKAERNIILPTRLDAYIMWDKNFSLEYTRVAHTTQCQFQQYIADYLSIEAVSFPFRNILLTLVPKRTVSEQCEWLIRVSMIWKDEWGNDRMLINTYSGTSQGIVCIPPPEAYAWTAAMNDTFPTTRSTFEALCGRFLYL